MVAAFVTLCNSACITCIWCFLLSICFPKFVESMDETDSDELRDRKFGRRGRRLSCESLEPFAIRRPKQENKESNANGKRNSGRELPILSIGSSDQASFRNRRSRDVGPVHRDAATLRGSTSLETLDSATVYREDRSNRSIGDRGEVANGLGMRFLEMRERPLRDYSREKPNRCYRGCENRESGCRGNSNSWRREVTEPRGD